MSSSDSPPNQRNSHKRRISATASCPSNLSGKKMKVPRFYACLLDHLNKPTTVRRPHLYNYFHGIVYDCGMRINITMDYIVILCIKHGNASDTIHHTSITDPMETVRTTDHARPINERN
eukprot:836116_1